MVYINKFDEEAVKALQKEITDSVIWGIDKRTEEEKYEDDIKIGIVLINGKQEMINIHTGNMKGYKTGSYYSLEKPLEEIKYDEFVRWARGMDF